jgi:thioesterase domain-containing protein
MAAHYIEEIRSRQPQGPYRLGGYSFGGAVAYEMARQLAAAGQEVEFLALLDAYGASGSLVRTFLELRAREKFAYLVSKRQLISRRIRSRVQALSYPAALKQVHAANLQAEKAYGWPPYDGPVWLFRASDKGLRGRAAFSAQWHVHEFDGDHGSIIREPRVGDLARRMSACMDGVACPA